MPGPDGCTRRVIASRAREKIVLRILGINAALDRMPAKHNIFLRERQRSALGYQNLQLHEIQTGHQLGHRMFHLQARVDFEKVEVLPAVEKKLDGPGIRVAGIERQPDRRFSHALAQAQGSTTAEGASSMTF